MVDVTVNPTMFSKLNCAAVAMADSRLSLSALVGGAEAVRLRVATTSTESWTVGGKVG